MKKKECPSCAMDVDAKADYCPVCGYEFPQQSKITQWIVIILVIFLLYLWMR
ncbi:MAG: hypothetical protein OEW75_04760 [Cyclobacteriaceae bacterium]|nr:hypothetical protein [Cyclobacteriaceae bacterium]